MISVLKQPVQDFVTDYALKRADGATVFNATIMYYNKGKLHTIISEVHIVNIKTTMVIYICEFFNPDYQFTEMYSTAHYNFGYHKGSALEISNTELNHPLHIVIIPSV